MVWGLSLIGVNALWSLCKTHSSLVLVQSRKTCPKWKIVEWSVKNQTKKKWFENNTERRFQWAPFEKRTTIKVFTYISLKYTQFKRHCKIQNINTSRSLSHMQVRFKPFWKGVQIELLLGRPNISSTKEKRSLAVSFHIRLCWWWYGKSIWPISWMKLRQHYGAFWWIDQLSQRSN